MMPIAVISHHYYHFINDLHSWPLGLASFGLNISRSDQSPGAGERVRGFAFRVLDTSKLRK